MQTSASHHHLEHLRGVQADHWTDTPMSLFHPDPNVHDLIPSCWNDGVQLGCLQAVTACCRECTTVKIVLSLPLPPLLPPLPLFGASVTCVMHPTSRSLLSGTPAPPLEPPASSLLSPANLNLALLMLEVSLMFRVVGGRLALPSLLHGRLTGLHQT